MLIIRLNNQGGTLDQRQARTGKAAAEAAIELIVSCGELQDGDTIEITGNEEEDDD